MKRRWGGHGANRGNAGDTSEFKRFGVEQLLETQSILRSAGGKPLMSCTADAPSL
jgi:hypothetical protein